MSSAYTFVFLCTDKLLFSVDKKRNVSESMIYFRRMLHLAIICEVIYVLYTKNINNFVLFKLIGYVFADEGVHALLP